MKLNKEWSEQEKILCVKKYQSSGLSRKDYAVQAGISFERLRKWITAYGDGSRKSVIKDSNNISFVELVGTKTKADYEGVEINFGSQVVVKLGCVGREELITLVKALSDARASI